MGPNGDLSYVRDSDGHALNTGGIAFPKEFKPLVGYYYYRFIGTTSARKFGMPQGIAGGWWLDHESFKKLDRYASEIEISLSDAAHRALAIPEAWSDCHYAGRAELSRSVRAYSGPGKPAAQSSPYNPKRDKTTDPVSVPLSHLEIRQIFVPGNPDLLSRCFAIDKARWIYCRKAGKSF